MKYRKCRKDGCAMVDSRRAFADNDEEIEMTIRFDDATRPAHERQWYYIAKPKQYLRECWKDTYWSGLYADLGCKRWDGEKA